MRLWAAREITSAPALSMAYHTLADGELDNISDTDDCSIPISLPSAHPSFALQPSLSAEDTQYRSHTGQLDQTFHDSLENMIKSMISTRGNYNMVEDDEYEVHEEGAQDHDTSLLPSDTTRNISHSPSSEDPYNSVEMPKPLYQDTMMRTVSREGSMRHPTPDLQSLQGAYVSNIERLELSAERLSMSSDIGEEVRKIRMEQKRSESRKSSLAARSESSIRKSSVTRHLSASSNASHSILSVNSIARSGGFSPAGYAGYTGYVTSPIGSLRSPSWSHNSIRERSISQGDRLMTQISEPEKEGQPLDSPISVRSVPIIQAPRYPSHAREVNTQSEADPDAERHQDIDHVGASAHVECHENANDVRPSSFINHYDNLDEARLGSPIDIAQSEGLEQDQDQHIENFPERPTTAASTDTYQQTNALFADFDGVHTTSYRQPSGVDGDETSHHVSFTQPPLASQSQAYADSPIGENMIYYPAPVPMMLNLPQRLSKIPAIQRDKRVSHMRGTGNTGVRKSAAWLPGATEDSNGDLEPDTKDKLSKQANLRRSIAGLPPQLRASMFFDHPSVPQDVEIKGDSAVATLDSILDASAFAPVNAFTDHPIAGHAGGNIFGKSLPRHSIIGQSHQQVVNRRSKSSINLLKQRHSSATLPTDGHRSSSIMSIGRLIGKRESSAPQLAEEDTHYHHNTAQLDSERVSFLHSAEDNEQETGLEHEGTEEENLNAEEDFSKDAQAYDDDDAYDGPPTTLLAELQLRKEQQKQRNRTAATAFPQGMHSTLLQLDAVAQVEKESRKQRHVTLAWEDPKVRHPGIENEDDEDVPLGMLFSRGNIPDKEIARRYDENRPLGLIARRAIEDNEPLSQRRARLRGEPHLRATSPNKQLNTLKRDLPASADAEYNEKIIEDDETLGQRLNRIKAHKNDPNARPISGDFASEVLSQFGGPIESNKPGKLTNGQDRDPEGETLGQRRKRLQAQREAKAQENSEGYAPASRPSNRQSHSMADISQAHPIMGPRSFSHDKVLTVRNHDATSGNEVAVDLLRQRHQLNQTKSNASLTPNSSSAPMTTQNTKPGSPPVFVHMMSGIGAPSFSGHSNNVANTFAQNNGIAHVHSNTLLYANPMAFHGGSIGINGYSVTAPSDSRILPATIQDKSPVDTKHREMINRWRQSVNY